MTKKEKRIISDQCDWEGIDYALTFKSSYPEIKDKEFHRLRNEFLEARKRLLDYCDIDEFQ